MDITDVLAAHDGWGFNGWHNGEMVQLCECGHMFTGGKDEHAGHVADALRDTLGLRKERRTNVMSSAGQMTNWKTGVTTHHSDMRYDCRWVTAWQVDKSQQIVG